MALSEQEMVFLQELFMRHFILTDADRALPLYAESVGYNPGQRPYVRDGGYPCWHWLQTGEGAGEISFGGKRYLLEPGKGVLLPPNEPHAYEAATAEWTTWYLTFGGVLAQSLAHTFGVQSAAFYRLHQPEVMTGLLRDFMLRVRDQPNLPGGEGSLDVYHFLLLLKQHGQAGTSAPAAKTELRLAGLIAWLHVSFANPELGIAEMALRLGITPQHLNVLFSAAYGDTPYAYLLKLRIRNAKERLIAEPGLAVKAVAVQAGFKDASHFVATFRRLTGYTPEAFRRMFG